jgi:glutathione S-transferase
VTALLITIPLSHYCEKARWALDRVRLPYREEAHAPLFHRMATRRHAGSSVPVLVHGDQKLTESAAILEHADQSAGGGVLYPIEAAQRAEVAALEQRFDKQLGPHIRRWGYGHLLSQPGLLRSVWSRGVPRFEARLLLVTTSLTVRLVRAGYDVTPASAQRSLEHVHRIFDEVGQRLGDGRRYLAGDHFTAADLTFASLAAPAVFPAEYGGVLPALDVLPPAMRESVSRLRETAAGRFALRLYATERR